MSQKIVFNPKDQSQIATVAAEVFTRIEHSLPSVPWLSNKGQQDSYEETVKVISNEINKLNADIQSKKAIEFWALNIVYANNRKFRVAVAAFKSLSMRGISPALTFPQTVKSNINPRDIVAEEMPKWESDSMYEKYT